MLTRIVTNLGEDYLIILMYFIQQKAHKMKGNYSSRNFKYFIEQFWKRVGEGIKSQYKE